VREGKSAVPRIEEILFKENDKKEDKIYWTVLIARDIFS